MEISYLIQDDILVVTLESESLDARESAEFKQSLHKIIEESGVVNVIFDLHKLHFIDSSGLGSFLSILRLLTARRGTLKLCALTDSVEAMFELVSMEKVFEMYPNTSEALVSFHTPDYA